MAMSPAMTRMRIAATSLTRSGTRSTSPSTGATRAGAARTRRRAGYGSAGAQPSRPCGAGRRCRTRRCCRRRGSRSSTRGRGSGPWTVPGPRDLVRLLVQLQVGEGEPGRTRLAAGAPQHRADPRGQLLEAERLGDVVVAAEGQAADLVVGRVPGGQEHHGGTGTGVAQLPDDLEAVQVGQHHVEHHEIRALLAGQLHRLGTVGRGGHRETGEAQGGGEQLEDVRIVLHHEQSRLTLRRTGQRGTPGLCPAVRYPHMFHRRLRACAMTEVCLGIAWEWAGSTTEQPAYLGDCAGDHGGGGAQLGFGDARVAHQPPYLRRQLPDRPLQLGGPRVGPGTRTGRPPRPAARRGRAGFPGRLAQLPLEVPKGAADLLLDLAGEGGEVGHRGVDLALQVGQLAGPLGQLAPARVGDAVDLPAAGRRVGHQAFGLQPLQAWIDRAGRWRVEPEEPVLQQADQLVPVLRPLGEQLEQVQPQSTVAEHRGHAGSSKSGSVISQEVMRPPFAVEPGASRRFQANTIHRDMTMPAPAIRARLRRDAAGPGWIGAPTRASTRSPRSASTRRRESSSVSSPMNAGCAVGSPATSKRSATGTTGAPASTAAWKKAGRKPLAPAPHEVVPSGNTATTAPAASASRTCPTLTGNVRGRARSTNTPPSRSAIAPTSGHPRTSALATSRHRPAASRITMSSQETWFATTSARRSGSRPRTLQRTPRTCSVARAQAPTARARPPRGSSGSSGTSTATTASTPARPATRAATRPASTRDTWPPARQCAPHVDTGAHIRVSPPGNAAGTGGRPGPGREARRSPRSRSPGRTPARRRPTPRASGIPASTGVP